MNYLINLSKATTLALAVLCFASCQQSSEKDTASVTNQATAASEQLQFDTKSLHRTSDDCASDSSMCAKLEISYPVAITGPEKLKQSINKYVQQRLQRIKRDFNPDTDTSATGDAATALADFFLSQRRQYVEKMQAMPDMPMALAAWELQVKGVPVYTSPRLVSLRFDTYYFTGGAHPNAYSILQSFDSTGNALRAADLVTDTLQLKQLVEQQFRQVRKEMVGDKSLSAAGLFIKGDTLPLPQNYALTAEGLLLYYNPYEIGPYVMGGTELLLSYTQLQGLLKPAYQP